MFYIRTFISVFNIDRGLLFVTEMIEKDFVVRSDRSYLCLVAIYVIHALLLNVFLQPQLDMRSSVTLSSSYVRSSTQHLNGRNGSDTVMAISANNFSSIINSTSNLERRTIGDVDDEYSGEPSTGALLHQSKSGGAAIRFLTAPKTSRVSRMASNAFDSVRQIVKSLSPAALGILSGCIVFLLTFTENDYV